MYEALAPNTLRSENIFMVLYFIYGLTVFTNCEALMRLHFSECVGRRAGIQCTADEKSFFLLVKCFKIVCRRIRFE